LLKGSEVVASGDEGAPKIATHVTDENVLCSFYFRVTVMSTAFYVAT
jgi:hypothetical protein